MISKVIKLFSSIIIPTIIGIVIVWGLFEIESIINIKRFGPDEDIHLDATMIFFPLAIVLFLVQVFFILPIWSKYKTKQKLLKLTLYQFFLIVSVIGGFSLGYFLWAKEFGIIDLLIGSLVGFASLAIYFTANLLSVNQIEKLSN